MLFPIKELACDLFTVFEHGRIRTLLNRFYPGIARQSFPMLRLRAYHINKTEKQTDPVFLLYAWVALGIPREESFGISSSIKKHVEIFADLFERKIQEDYSVETCAKLVLKTYHDIESLIRKTTGWENLEIFYIPLKTPWGRRLHPSLFFSAYQDYEQIAEKLKNRLKEKGLDIAKSDVRKRLMEKHGSISADDIKEILQVDESDNSVPGAFDDLWVQDLFDSSVNQPYILMSAQPGSVFWYREWDCNMGDYIHDHARVLGY